MSACDFWVYPDSIIWMILSLWNFFTSKRCRNNDKTWSRHLAWSSIALMYWVNRPLWAVKWIYTPRTFRCALDANWYLSKICNNFSIQINVNGRSLIEKALFSITVFFLVLVLSFWAIDSEFNNPIRIYHWRRKLVQLIWIQIGFANTS